jgi:cation:H+ antiporter
MEIVFQIVIFLVSCVALFFGGQLMTDSSIKISRFLGWKEFVVAFFVISTIASFPEIIVGITSALKGIPELSFGNIMGANIIHFTIAIGFAALMMGGVPVNSKTVQIGAIYACVIGVFPLLMLLDGVLSRGDGALLILSFFGYSAWLFSKKEHFTQIYGLREKREVNKLKLWGFLTGALKLLVGSVLILASAQGIVFSASGFAQALNVPIGLIGLLIVGFGTAMPESFFSALSAKRDRSWMILGTLMGCVAITASVVLGTVALICPIKIADQSPYIISRIFLVISALFFLFFLRNDKNISKGEARFLLIIYILYLFTEIFAKNLFK